MGSGTGKTKRTRASNAAPKAGKHQVVPGERDLIMTVRMTRDVKLTSREVVGERITFLQHELQIPRVDADQGDMVGVWGNFYKTSPSSSTRSRFSTISPSSKLGFYDFAIEDLIFAFKEITEVAAEYPQRTGEFRLLAIGVPPNNNKYEYAALTYMPPRKKKDQGRIVFSRAGRGEESFSGNFHVSEGKQGYSAGPHQILGVFELRDAVAAAELLETMPGLEREFEEAQRQRWQEYYRNTVPIRVSSVDAKKVVF